MLLRARPIVCRFGTGRNGLPWQAVVLAGSLALLAGCKDENKFAPPPPPQVGVARPVQQQVLNYLEGTGNTVAVSQIDLVARVKGFLSSINYQDGAAAKRGDTLFVIEQAPYQAQLQQAQAALDIAKAKLVRSQADFDRQQTLLRQNVTAQTTLDQARATRDSDQGDVLNAEAGVTIAAINLGYTNVAAPFDGVVTQHLQSVGALVGSNGDTKLASLVQINPVYATFNVSEQDVLRVRAAMKERRLTQADFDNTDRTLLPGFFVHIRVPITNEPQMAMLVPNRILGSSQEGRTILVVNDQDEVEQRIVKLGAQYGDLRVIESGLKPDERIIVTGAGRAVPGRKVAPTDTVIADASASTVK
jgi:membrane fusion protein, multidrug efflux system